MDEPTASMLLGATRARQSSETLADRYRHAAMAWFQAPAPDVMGLQDILMTDLNLSLPADMLHKVDLASMVHNLEVRVPLLSTDVVEFVTGLPIEYKVADTTGKRILRDAFRDILPAPVLTRAKMGFEVPVGEFLRCELRDMYRDLVTEQTLSTFGLAPSAAAELYDAHCRRRADYTELLWSLLVLCGWKHTTAGA